MSGLYTFLAADLVTNNILDELPLSGVTAGLTLNGLGQFNATLDLADSALRKALDPIGATQTGRTIIYIDRDGVLVGGWVVWTRTYDSTTKKLTLGGQDVWSYFRSRLIKADATFAGQDQLAIAHSLINTAQAATGGNIGVVVGTETSGVLRDRTYYGYEYKPVAEAVEQLAAVQGGFDFRIDVAYINGVPTKRLILGYPQIGQTANVSNLVFEYADGGNIMSYTYPEDSTTQAVSSTATGAGDGPAALTSTATNSALITGGYPLLEEQTTYGDISVQATLDAHAQANLAAHDYPVVVPEFVVDPKSDPVLGSYICGDYARFVINDERFPRHTDGSAGYDAWQRISQISLQVADAAGTAEQVKISCGATA